MQEFGGEAVYSFSLKNIKVLTTTKQCFAKNYLPNSHDVAILRTKRKTGDRKVDVSVHHTKTGTLVSSDESYP